MADNNQTKPNEEVKIPVFTVLKNNAILKNIFLLDNPPSISDKKFNPSLEKVDKSDQETEEILTVGRHPDCTIMLTHPSISRFHLRIHSEPSLQKLSVIDLSSVHGTWVSERKIEPGVLVELNEGDTIRLGGSSRVYRLYWVPLNRAYDLENPFVSLSDLSTKDEKEEQNVISGGDYVDETCEDDDSLSLKNKDLQLLDSISEVVQSVFSDEILEYFVRREVPAPSMPEELNTEVSDVEKILNPSLCFEPNSTETVNCLAVEGFLLDTDNKKFDDENQFSVGPTNAAEPQPLVIPEVLSEMGNSESPQKSSEHKSKLQDKLNSLSFDKQKESSAVAEVLVQIKNQSPAKRDPEDKDWSGNLETKSMKLPTPSRSVPLEIENQQFKGKSQTPTSLYARDELSGREISGSPPLRTEEKLNLLRIWSRRGKPSTVLNIQTGRIKGKGEEVGTETEVIPKNHEGDENKTIAKNLCFGLEEDGDETFTPDKENLTPNTLPVTSRRRKDKAEEKNHLMSYRLSSSKVAVSPNIAGEDMFASSDNENQTPKVLQERPSARSSSRVRLEQEMTNMKRRADRVPFQSLLLNSAANSKSEASVFYTTARSSTSVNCGQSLDNRTDFCSNNAVGEEGKRRWYMVVDTSSLLNKESRKALQLLQGLKGTQLIIPRMVVRELHCLKRRASLFRRMTEVCSVLQWIDECTVSTNWWMHIQNSLEGRPIARTPPASPQSRYSEKSGGIPSRTTNSLPSSACGSLIDVSPTAEDHILEFALLYRRLNRDGQLVLFSNDVTVKIKAMAEGLICETVEEFRESLVNPFSERFLWAESSPRGQTWSCLDDIVLREKYYSCPLKKASKGGECIKGLKLILPHNSHYGQIENSQLRQTSM